MNSSRHLNLVCALAVLFVAANSSIADEKKPVGDKPQKKQDGQAEPKSRITVAKDVTFYTKPLDKAGYVDYGAALNAHYSKGVTPENNAVVLLYHAFGPKPDGTAQPDEFFKLLGMPKPPAEGNYFKPLGHALKARGVKRSDPEWQQLFDEQSISYSRVWKDGELKLIAEWIKLNEGPMKHVEAAVLRKYNYSPIVIPRDDKGVSSGLIATLLPGIQQSRDFARVLGARAMNHLGEGRVQQAWNDLMVMRKLGRLIAQGPTLIEALVGIAIENIGNHSTLVLIEHTQPDAKQVAKYLADLDGIEKTHPMSRMADKVETTERSMYMDCVQLLARGSLNLEQLAGVTGGGDFGNIMQKYATGLVEWDIVLRKGNVWYDRMVKIMRMDDYVERSKAVAKANEDIKKMAQESRAPINLLRFLDPKKGREAASDFMGDVMVALLLPAVQQARIAEDLATQNGRHLRIALALSAYKKKNGSYPAKLSDVKPYLGAVPRDIFTGEELNYKVTKDGYLVYSVGPNGKDEGGRWYNDDPRGDDVNIRMPIPIKD
jgi:hypothetical protein